MNNDLISRSALLEDIRSYVFDTVNPDTRRGEHAAKAHICELIEKQPIAYDVDKVVEQLEETSIEELGINRAQFDMDRGEYSSYCSLCLYDVKEIVKAGGID